MRWNVPEQKDPADDAMEKRLRPAAPTVMESLTVARAISATANAPKVPDFNQRASARPRAATIKDSLMVQIERPCTFCAPTVRDASARDEILGNGSKKFQRPVGSRHRTPQRIQSDPANLPHPPRSASNSVVKETLTTPPRSSPSEILNH